MDGDSDIFRQPNALDQPAAETDDLASEAGVDRQILNLKNQQDLQGLALQQILQKLDILSSKMQSAATSAPACSSSTSVLPPLASPQPSVQSPSPVARPLPLPTSDPDILDIFQLIAEL